MEGDAAQELGAVVSCGYIVTKLVTRPSYSSKELLPDRIVSVSPCIAPIAAALWAVSWSQIVAHEREREAARFGLVADDLPRVLALTDRLLEAGDLLSPGFFQSDRAARNYVAALGLENVVVLGIGLAAGDVDLFLENASDQSHAWSAPSMVARRQPIQAGGVALGFEVLGNEWAGEFHSWLCNSLERVLSPRLDLHLNEYGLISSYEDAAAVAQIIDDEEIGEPVPWFAWQITRYPSPRR